MAVAVSVIVPVRDRRCLLGRCLDALAAQAYADFEVIVVDDGSTDGSCAEAARRGSPFHVVRTEGIGAVAARRAGVDAATGDILAFTDSDCVPAPDWLSTGASAVQAGADVVQGLTRPARPVRPLERSLWSDFDDGLFATCNVFYRRAAYEAAGGFRSERLGFRPDAHSRSLGMGEDTLLGWRVRRQGVAVFEPRAVVEHHVFRGDVREAIRRAWTTGAFPALVGEAPELRQTLLVDGWMLGSRRRLWLYAGVALTGLGRPRLASIAFAGWVGAHARRVWRDEPVRRRAMKALPAVLAVDAVTGAALLTGSARARRLVL